MTQSNTTLKWMPVLAAAVCLLAFAAWWLIPAPREELRTPKKWNRTGAIRKEQKGAEVTTPGLGRPSTWPGDWPGLRGPHRDNIAVSAKPLPRSWPAGGPKVLWRVAVGEGHAGAAIHQGKVYLIDYDNDKKRDVIRCLSLDDGKEIWRTSYPVVVKQNHGRSRTVPAVTDKYVVTIGPMHDVYCCDAVTGRIAWKKNFEADNGTIKLPWYAGQCPLIDGDRVILAPAAKPLMMAVDLATGKEIWRTKDHEDLGITHSSIAIVNFAGQKQYVYMAHDALVGVAAEDGRVLWAHPVWAKAQAYVPTPIAIDNERIFFSAGYGAGCMMVKLVKDGGEIKVQELWRLKAPVFGSDQQTPILYKERLYSTLPPIDSGELACLDLSGKRLWTGGGDSRIALGPYLMTSDGLLLALSGRKGTLAMGTVDGAGYKELARAQVVEGHDCWGPMAFAEGRLLLRNLTELVCLNLGQ